MAMADRNQFIEISIFRAVDARGIKRRYSGALFQVLYNGTTCLIFDRVRQVQTPSIVNHPHRFARSASHFALRIRCGLSSAYTGQRMKKNIKVLPGKPIQYYILSGFVVLTDDVERRNLA